MGRREFKAHPLPIDAKKIVLPELHSGQLTALRTLLPHRFKALRCGRRFGKTELAKAWIAHALLQRQQCAWFAPQHVTSSEVWAELADMLDPIVQSSSRTPAILRLSDGGRLDFWSLENGISGRGRGYSRVVIDEAAFAKNGDLQVDDSMMSMWEKVIKPTLYDTGGEALVCSNSAGKNPDNFFFSICNDPKHGFREFHATTEDNPLLPLRNAGESLDAWLSRREAAIAELRSSNHPLVYAQEYMAEFVDWSGAAFFSPENLLVEGQPVAMPTRCEYVFAVIDTASKTGTDNDATAVTYFAREKFGPTQLFVLDWDIAQIEGAFLETWLPGVFRRLEELARLCGARGGSAGAFIEDKNSGTVLLQQSRQRNLPASPIESKLTSLGKDERAISVSKHVHLGRVKYTADVFNKKSVYKGRSLNHLLAQVESFRVGDNKSKREDDLLDTFCYGIALALGNREGF